MAFTLLPDSVAASDDQDIVLRTSFALDGDPKADAAALGRVVFVMRAGTVFRNEPGSGQ